MAPNSKLSFATAWINNFQKSTFAGAGDLKHCDDVANGFGKIMEKQGHKWEIKQEQDDAHPEDWIDRNPLRKPPPGTKVCAETNGQDDKPGRGADTVDLAMIVSHGGHQMEPDYGPICTVGFNRAPGWFCNNRARFGNTKLKWLILDCCHSLETGNDPKRYNPPNLWRQAFDGLHTIFGFNGITMDSFWTCDHGEQFAARIAVWNEALADAWIDCSSNWTNDDNPGAAAAGRDKNDAVNRLDTETLSSSFDSIPNKEVKYIAWRLRTSDGSPNTGDKSK
jgi:hypothetical protein